jgi:hypothetical protein
MKVDKLGLGGSARAQLKLSAPITTLWGLEQYISDHLNPHLNQVPLK